MPTIDTTIEAFLASKNLDPATISRLGFWSQQFSHKELSDISEEDVDNALVTLSTRGKMIPVRMMAEESGELLREFFRQRR
jgi:hypothetical protein